MNTQVDVQPATPSRDYSAFDAELTHKALNVNMFVRLLAWLKPYRFTLSISIVLTLASAALAVLQPIVNGRVVIDTILLPNPKSNELPDYGMGEFVYGVADWTGASPLMSAVFVYALLVLVSSLASYGHRLLLARSTLQALRDLRSELFRKLETKPMSFYDHVSVGRVMTRLTNDVENLIELLTGVLELVGDFIPFFLALFLMWAISPELTLYTMVFIPVVAVATSLFRKVLGNTYRNVRNAVSSINQYMQENLIGMEVVQLSRRERLNTEQFGERNASHRDYQFHAMNLETVYNAFNNSLITVATGVIIWVGGGEVIQDAISLGSVVVFTQLIGMMIGPVQAVGYQFNSLFRAMASGERIFQAIDWDESIKEPDNPVSLPDNVHGRLEFRNMSFSYYMGEEVIHDVSFTVKAGEKLAIVGPTGSGKSTLIKLLARFYDFDDGKVFLDDVDVNHIASVDLRHRVGIVLQDFHIFSGTVLDNITLNSPGISNEDAMEAARIVNADPFIRALPQGYDTLLSERGLNLSQGQRQLLAFARVLAADPEILVLDEATASIDTATELVIQEALHRVMEGRTSIVIAHRLQTIRECDKVLVLHHGEVREYGSHEELMALEGIYYTLHELQFQDSRVAAELSGDTGGGTAGERTLPRTAPAPEEPDDEEP